MTDYVRRHWVRFLKYSVFGVLAFSFELVLLALFVEHLGLTYQIAVPIAFSIATSAQYLGIRAMVFHDTIRYGGHGFTYFLAIMSVSALLTTFCMAALVDGLGVSLYPARILVGTVLGIASYFFHSKYNFKVQ